jgi:D-tyrosyl-tRNA(Tyr) deacylase
MKAVLQRVARASVRVGEETVAEIGPGVCVLLGVGRSDGEDEAARLAGKMARLRVFEDENGRFDRSLLDVGGEALVVSQFTLLGDTTRQKGTRPDFSEAAPRAQAEPLYEAFCDELRAVGVPIATGVFGARMAVELVSEGPVTIVLEV